MYHIMADSRDVHGLKTAINDSDQQKRASEILSGFKNKHIKNQAIKRYFQKVLINCFVYTHSIANSSRPLISSN